MSKKKDLLGLGFIGAGAIFLFNPTVNIFDPLPDLLGFWLIAYGLTVISYLSDLLAEARKNFVYLSFLEAAKLLICLTVPGTTGTYVVLMTFVFSVAEAMLFLPGASKLFEGLSSLGMRYGSDSAFKVPVSSSSIAKANRISVLISKTDDIKKIIKLRKKHDKLVREKTVGYLKLFTLIAFCVRLLCSFFPTLPALGLYGDTLFVTEGQINWSDYVGVMYIVSWIIGFSVGIPWLRAFRRYFKALKSEEAFTSPIYRKYEDEILCDKGRLSAEKMKKVMILCVIAVAFLVQFPIDHVWATPNLIAAGFMIASLVYLLPEAKKGAVAGICASSVWAVLSAVGVWLQVDYAKQNYDPAAAVAFGGEGRGMADELYFRMELFSYAEAVMFLVSVFIFAKVFMKVLSVHIAMMPKRMDGTARDEKKLKKCLLPVGICGGVAVLFNGALTFVTKYFAGAWIINGLAVAVMFVFALLAYYKLSDRVYLPHKRKF